MFFAFGILRKASSRIGSHVFLVTHVIAKNRTLMTFYYFAISTMAMLTKLQVCFVHIHQIWSTDCPKLHPHRDSAGSVIGIESYGGKRSYGITGVMGVMKFDLFTSIPSWLVIDMTSFLINYKIYIQNSLVLNMFLKRAVFLVFLLMKILYNTLYLKR